VVVEGVLEYRKVGRPGHEYEMPWVRVCSLKVAEEGLADGFGPHFG
jgi:hypothetical protein